MPLHEYLERKRRENIDQLNASGACHICGSSCRTNNGLFSRFLSDNAVDNGITAVATDSPNVDGVTGTRHSARGSGGFGEMKDDETKMMDISFDDSLNMSFDDVTGVGEESNPRVKVQKIDTNKTLKQKLGDKSWESPLFSSPASTRVSNSSRFAPLVRPMGMDQIPSEPKLANMRTCNCYGIPPSDPNHWPYSLKVCEMCIADDIQTGRIRCCGICGAVACDEDCGVELVECTDSEEWNNAGCLECRGKESFSDIDLFRTIPPHGHPRITRVCTKCLHQSTPWVKYDFVCRRFKCKTRLVPSHVAERKRFSTFGSSPLNLLPEDGLVAIVDFLAAEDLKRLFMTCSAMCTVAERVAKEKVERVHHLFPTGPITLEKKAKGAGQWVIAEGGNDFNLRAPDDAKAWVGVYSYIEKMTADAFYFGFQMSGRDKNAAARYLQNRHEFAFREVYSKVRNVLTLQMGDMGLQIRGGQILNRGGFGAPSPLTIVSGSSLNTGVHHFICRLFCPGSDTPRTTPDVLGSVGVFRKKEDGTVEWAGRHSIMEGWQKEEGVIGVEYNSETRVLLGYQVMLNRPNRMTSFRTTLDETQGNLFFATELSVKALEVEKTLLSVRELSEREWEQFIAHTPDIQPASNIRDERMQRIELMGMAMEDAEEHHGLMRRAQLRIRRTRRMELGEREQANRAPEPDRQEPDQDGEANGDVFMNPARRMMEAFELRLGERNNGAFRMNEPEQLEDIEIVEAAVAEVNPNL